MIYYDRAIPIICYFIELKKKTSTNKWKLNENWRKFNITWDLWGTYSKFAAYYLMLPGQQSNRPI